MPPRLRSANLSSAVTSCPASRAPTVPQPVRRSREFSQTSCHQITLRRRKFYEWLNGPGKQLKQPLPGSTNYLGAYDRYGNLVRAGPGWKRPTPTTEAKTSAEKKDAPRGQEQTDELEMAVRRDEEAKKEEQAGESLRPETEEDLRPFPLNKYFRSQSVLSEDLREEIYQRVMRDGATVSLASIEFGVSNERVGAVVRLKQMEKEWIAQGKQLALPYSRAVMDMLPKTPLIDQSKPENKGKRPIPHEPINDLIVHPATRQQLFVPVAESRHFTRVDAGEAFDNELLPADKRIPHPELVQAEREIAQGLSRSERQKLASARFAADAEAKKRKEEAQRAHEARTRKVVPQRRWDYVFTNVSVEDAGRDGRGVKGVGWRYGFPHEDRKKGQVKIPTKVEA